MAKPELQIASPQLLRPTKEPLEFSWTRSAALLINRSKKKVNLFCPALESSLSRSEKRATASTRRPARRSKFRLRQWLNSGVAKAAKDAILGMKT
jgi:hypothetical protein